MSHFLKTLQKQVLLCDGATGTLLQTFSIDTQKDLLGRTNCYDLLNLTRPDIPTQVHRAYLEAGADCIKTNTFNANAIILAEHDLADRAYEINLEAAKIAKKIAGQFSSSQQPRFVLGAFGPGSKLPSLGHITYDELCHAYAQQIKGLLDGQVDALLLETFQDLLSVKAALGGYRLAQQEHPKKNIPIFVQITMERSGAMLTGSPIEAVVTALEAMDIDGLGLNCGTGPQEMLSKVQYLSAHWRKLISVMPNAGLPVMENGKTVYPLSPLTFVQWVGRFVEDYGVNLVGGCCGTTPAHIHALRNYLTQRKNKCPKKRKPVFEPSISSLFQSVSLRQENAILLIGERTNAHGSKQFREMLKADNWDGMVALAKQQVKEGAQAIDICVSYTGRSEIQDIEHFISLCRTQITIPFVIDSTQPEVIESALKLLGGKSIINSINLEDADKAHAILRLAKQLGAAVIALTIDETGMAKTVEEKIRIATQLYDLAVNHYHLPPSDLLLDPLTFTICTGMDADRNHAVNTLHAVECLSKQFPECQIILGLSNVSFGLKETPRQVLNSVFLHHARLKGMTAAILHTSKILPLHKIPPQQTEAAENLIFNRTTAARDPLLHFVNLFSAEDKKTEVIKENLSIEEQLTAHILDGIKDGLTQHLQKALEQYSALDIINKILLPAMGRVGELFGCGTMQLPFVLQSAEVMKTGAEYLESFFDHSQSLKKGVIVLATVQGDVHDIGKNLVDIILSNNGYHVINIGIKKTIDEIIHAALANKADAIGMSGLLVQSTWIMKENLAEMQKRGISMPVLLGGAALTRGFVERDCQKVYSKGSVYYAEDAFAGLKIMNTWMRPLNT